MSRYTSQSTSGYNASPPADDGSEVAANQVKWSTIKTKLADVLKTFGEAIDSQIQTLDGVIYPSGVTTTATNLTLTTATHNGKNIRVTGASTITLPEAASATTTFRCVITKTETANTVTIDTQNSETIDGSASVTLTENGESVGIVCDGSNFFIDSRYLATLPYDRGFIDGLTMSNNGSDADHDLDIAAGKCRDSADSANISLTSAITKQINAAWAEGDAAGGFPSGLTSGAVQANTTYHVFVILNGTTVDAGFDTSLTATNLLSDASSYSEYRRIGSVITDGSANILAFTQNGDEFLLNTIVDDVDVTTQDDTTATTTTLTTPAGVKTKALIRVAISDGAAWAYLFSSLDESDQAPVANDISNIQAAASGQASNEFAIWTNTSSQIRRRGSTVVDNLWVGTHGWIDQRGRNA